MIAGQLSAHIQQAILDNDSPDPAAQLALLARLLNVAAARSPRQLLEITLLQSALPAAAPAPVQKMAAVQPPRSLASQPVETKQPAAAPAETDERPAQKDPTPEAPPELEVPAPEPESEEPALTAATGQPASVAKGETVDATELWHQTLEAIKKQYNTLYGIARMAT